MTNAIKRTALAVAVVPIALVLSGCLSVTTTMVVNSDATASGEFSIAVAREPAALLGISSADALNGALGESGQADFAASSDCVASEDDTFLRLTCPFENQAFNDPTDWLQVQREGDSISIAVRNEGQQEDLIDMPLGTLTFEVQTPGPIRSITGAYATQTADNAARVSASMSDKIDVLITSDATGSASLAWLPIAIGLAILVMLIAIVVLLVLLLKRRRPAPQGTQAPAASSPDVVAPAASAPDANSPDESSSDLNRTDASPSDGEPPSVSAT